MEPIRKKLRRWILGERNLPNESILEQDLSEITGVYPPKYFNDLTNLFMTIDQQLYFGFGYKYMMRVYKSMGLKFDEKEKDEFFRQSGYFRKLNQATCSMTLKDFLKELHERFKSLQKEPNPLFLSFEEFLITFQEKSKQIIEKQRHWEARHFLRRKEIMTLNAVYKDDKLAKTFDIMGQNPLEDLSRIVEDLSKSGYSVSLYERIFILKAQLAYANMMLKSYNERSDASNNVLLKRKYFSDIRDKLTLQLENESANFSLLFKKPMSSYYY